MAKKQGHVKIKDLEKKLTIIAVVIVAGLIGAYTLGFSFAAKGGNKGSGKTDSSTYLTKATDQQSTAYLVGELVREKGTKLWRTAVPVKGGGDISVINWQSKQAYVGFSAGTYRTCFNFRTNKPADVKYLLTFAGNNKGAQEEYSAVNLTSSNAYTEFCHDFVVIPENDKTGDPEWSLYSGLQIQNDATLEISQSSIAKIN